MDYDYESFSYLCSGAQSLAFGFGVPSLVFVFFGLFNSHSGALTPTQKISNQASPT